MEGKGISKRNVALKATVKQQKDKIKRLEHEKFVDAKAYRTSDIEKEEAHKLAIARLCEEHALKIDEAFEFADKETSKKLEAEKARILADSQYSNNLRKERQRSSVNLKKRLADQADVIKQSHQRWIDNMVRNLASEKRLHARNLASQQRLHANDNKFNQDR